MATDNSVTLVGNVTRDPELRFTNTGQANVTFGLAVNRRWQNRQTQEWEEATSFFDVVCWREMAENVSETITRGARVMVAGRLEQRSWETQEGDRRSKVEVVADEIGPSLRWATAQITKNERRGPGEGSARGGGGGSGAGAGTGTAAGTRRRCGRRLRIRRGALLMARNNQRGGRPPAASPKDLGRRVKKKPCALCRDKVEWVDYKDVPMLRKYMSDRGKIRSRRVTGNCAQHQRALARPSRRPASSCCCPTPSARSPSVRAGVAAGDRAERTLGDTPAGRGAAPARSGRGARRHRCQGGSPRPRRPSSRRPARCSRRWPKRPRPRSTPARHAGRGSPRHAGRRRMKVAPARRRRRRRAPRRHRQGRRRLRPQLPAARGAGHRGHRRASRARPRSCAGAATCARRRTGGPPRPRPSLLAGAVIPIAARAAGAAGSSAPSARPTWSRRSAPPRASRSTAGTSSCPSPSRRPGASR